MRDTPDMPDMPDTPDTFDQNTWWGTQIHGGEPTCGGEPTHMVAWPGWGARGARGAGPLPMFFELRS